MYMCLLRLKNKNKNIADTNMQYLAIKYREPWWMRPNPVRT